MGTRAYTPVERLPLVGGSPCIDFLNTTGQRAAMAPRERLHSYADLLTFCRRAKLLSASLGRELGGAAASRPKEAARELARAIELRELLYRIFLASTRARAPAPADADSLHAAQAALSNQRRLVWAGGKPRWTWTAKPGDLGCMRGPITAAALELLLSSELSLLQKCGECDWLFLDTSRNGNRRWCKKTCGDRVKARSYYRRQSAARKG